MDDRPPDRLPSRSSAGALIGGLLAGLEHALTNRPPPPAQIEERYHRPWAALNGVVVDGLEDPVERPEPPDRTGARL
ncbi:MAG TPA: hypothetical protein VFM03_05665 [Candidatus Limnocylindria bacterium]|nr:hypothetical protein [Candidatus Limnocylindria bacterium]